MTNEGIYGVPAAWPNCTETVLCGPPPLPTINGSITWFNNHNKVANAQSPNFKTFIPRNQSCFIRISMTQQLSIDVQMAHNLM